VRDEEALSTLKAQLAEAKVQLKDAEAKATSFAKEYGKEFYLRKQIAEQVQRTLPLPLPPPRTLTPPHPDPYPHPHPYP